ncbi:MAG: 50S ribosomal protein L5 [Candidatus Magasanikbacteria bacterium]|nr:50S ribosomal protein L5 [Candidatus Magasanikbacteria bacterium]MBT4071388.1 50S ribosomal protein L5 [Candidatus Magasanikbacteria bacterium]
MESVLYTQYKKEIAPALQKELEITNIMDVPKVDKVVINVGYGRHTKDKSFIENVEKTLCAITGQKPVHNLAKKSISNFKIREGADVGMSATLRGKQMYEFLYKLINLSFPRVRDFRGISIKGFDRKGNYTFGLKESIAFPEVDVEQIDKIHGLQVIISITADNKQQGLALLKKMGFPFQDA